MQGMTVVWMPCNATLLYRRERQLYGGLVLPYPLFLDSNFSYLQNRQAKDALHVLCPYGNQLKDLAKCKMENL